MRCTKPMKDMGKRGGDEGSWHKQVTKPVSLRGKELRKTKCTSSKLLVILAKLLNKQGDTSDIILWALIEQMYN